MTLGKKEYIEQLADTASGLCNKLRVSRSWQDVDEVDQCIFEVQTCVDEIKRVLDRDEAV